MQRSLRPRLKRPAPGTILGTVAIVIATSGIAVAGHQSSDVKSLTGCLKNGAIADIAVGDAPAKPCKPKETQVHLSAGDITAVNAGTGLAGGSTNGAAPVEIAPGFRLPQGCADGQVAKATTGGTYACGTDNDTTYSAGFGLGLNGTTFSADDTVLQRRVFDECAPGSSIRSIDLDGSVTCEEDTDTSGTGVSRHESDHRDVGFDETVGVSLTCGSGKHVLGGGWDLDDDDAIDGRVVQSYPVDEDTWKVTVYNHGLDDTGFRVVITCGNP